jgi:hypothetical protein
LQVIDVVENDLFAFELIHVENEPFTRCMITFNSKSPNSSGFIIF